MEYNLSSAWELIEYMLLPDRRTKKLITNNDLESVVSVLKSNDMLSVVNQWFIEKYRRHLQADVAPAFWKQFESPVENNQVVSVICETFQQLYDELHSYLPCLESIEQLEHIAGTESGISRTSAQDYMWLLLKAIGFSSTTVHFQDAILEFYSRAFRSFHVSPEPPADESGNSDELLSCPGCDEDRDVCVCSNTVQAFHTLNAQLCELGLLERLSGEAVSEIIHQRIQLHIETTCRGNFEQPYLPVLEKWLESKVVGWLELLYGQKPEENDKESSDPHTTVISSHKGRLYHFMYTVYATTRISELFTIIIEFPDSEPALTDLRTCLEKTDLRSHLVTYLRTALETRLLHPGVNTADILTAYISAIRALRVLEPSGVLLELVCQPVRTYLRCRDDTVRCIVSSLTEDSSSELSDELIKGEPLVLNESYAGDDEGEDWESWEPAPVDADPTRLAQSGKRSADIISMLVNIYGSKELFVNEYRTLLADRILTHFNYDTQKELRYLELLKLRFGESQLHYCEVMLKDVADSRRINSHIADQREKKKKAALQTSSNSDKDENTPEEDDDMLVNAMILSAEFWPTFREEKLALPERFQKCLDKYTKSFEALKGNRSLNWKTHLGLVQVELELKERKLELNVSPVHATIIWHFQDKPKWSVEELSSVMMMSTASIRRKMSLWQSHGLLREETPDTFVLVEESRAGQRVHDVVAGDCDEEAESAMASASDQREEELQVTWSYIVGMLTNLESLTLDRIHSMLKMFAMQGPSSECSQAELKDFLDRKVKDQKLMYCTGVYRLSKSGT